MSRYIYKYPLPLAASFRLELPRGAALLALQMQFNTPTLWALVNPEEPLESLDIVIEGTGQQHAEGYSRYLGTVQQVGMVWHFFARP